MGNKEVAVSIILATILYKASCSVYRKLNIALTELPDDIPADVSQIFLSSNQIQELHEGMFVNFTELEQLDISSNEISLIHNGAFLNTSIQILDLKNNVIHQFPNVSVIASTLTHLYLDNNFIVEIDCALLDPLLALQELHLSDNRLSTPPGTCGTSLFNLTSLHIQENRLSTVKNYSFIGLESIIILNSSKMRLRNVTNALIDRLPASLQYFYLQDSALENEDISAFVWSDHLTNMVEINLSNNSLTEMPSFHLNVANLLVTLELEKNLISSIPPYYLSNFSVIFALTLDENKLQSLETAITLHTSSLRRLSLRSNMINRTSSAAFQGLLHLWKCDLYNNSLTEFPNFGDSASNIGNIDVQYNNIVSLEQFDFRNYSRLQSLKLSFNNFRCLPDLSPLKYTLQHLGLSSINLTGCPVTMLEDLPILKSVAFINTGQDQIPMFHGSPLLKKIWIRDIRAETVPEDFMSHKIHLIILSLTACGLVTFPVIQNSSVEELVLASNGLDEFPNATGIATTLKILDLSFNLITSLNYSDVEVLTSLESLKMKGNPLGTVANISRLLSLQLFDIQNIQFICDNRLAWLKDGSADHIEVMISDFSCSSPHWLVSVRWTDITLDDLSWRANSMEYSTTSAMTVSTIDPVIYVTGEPHNTQTHSASTEITTNIPSNNAQIPVSSAYEVNTPPVNIGVATRTDMYSNTVALRESNVSTGAPTRPAPTYADDTYPTVFSSREEMRDYFARTEEAPQAHILGTVAIVFMTAELCFVLLLDFKAWIEILHQLKRNFRPRKTKN